MKVRRDASTDLFVEPFKLTIAYVDPDIAAKRVGENKSQIFSWHCAEDNESILPIVTSIMDMNILSIVNSAIASLPDSSRTIRELWGFWEEPNGDGGVYACNVTPIFDNNIAGRWVEKTMTLCNPMLVCIGYHGQQADRTAGAQMPLGVSRSYLHLNDILPPPA